MAGLVLTSPPAKGAGDWNKFIEDNFDAIKRYTDDNNAQMENITNNLGAYIVFNMSSNQSAAHNEDIDVIFGTVTKVGNAGNFAELTADKKIKILKKGIYAYSIVLIMDPASNSGDWYCASPGANQRIPLIVGLTQYTQLTAIRKFEANEGLAVSVKQTSGSSINLRGANVTLLRLGDLA